VNERTFQAAQLARDRADRDAQVSRRAQQRDMDREVEVRLEIESSKTCFLTSSFIAFIGGSTSSNDRFTTTI
jgi:E3 ubiquitin-protein ligase DOA10